MRTIILILSFFNYSYPISCGFCDFPKSVSSEKVIVIPTESNEEYSDYYYNHIPKNDSTLINCRINESCSYVVIYKKDSIQVNITEYHHANSSSNPKKKEGYLSTKKPIAYFFYSKDKSTYVMYVNKWIPNNGYLYNVLVKGFYNCVDNK
jgi:hypothetical protein